MGLLPRMFDPDMGSRRDIPGPVRTGSNETLLPVATMSEIPAKRILVVDDERVIADTLVTIFSGPGYEARAAYSAEQALELMEAWLPDLAILDVMLPQMNGVDLAIRMAALYPTCRTKLFSGHYRTAHLLTHAESLGHRFDVMAKPVPPGELLQMAAASFDERMRRNVA